MTRVQRPWLLGVATFLLATCTESTAPPAATKLAFTVQPSDATTGVAIRPAVAVAIEDATGKMVTSATNGVTVALGANPGNATLGGTTTVNALNGVATFGDLSIQKASSGYTITASSGGLTGTTSASFAIALPAAKLAFTVQPSNTVARGPITPAVVVTIQDTLGNTAKSATNAVTVALGANPGGGTLSGTTTVNAVNGVATFGDVSIWPANSGYTLTASSGTLRGATSAPFDVAPFGGPARLFFAEGLGTVIVAQPIQPFKVLILDSFWNLDSNATNAVTVTLGAHPAGATLAGTLTVTAVKGVASFANLTVDQPGYYSLAVSAGALLPDTSGQFAVIASGIFSAVSAGGNHTCGIKVVGPLNPGWPITGPAYCWGSNDHGQLGDGTTTPRTSPVPVAGGLTFSAVSAGGSHTCGVIYTGVFGAPVYCWGANAHGQLGDGSTTDRTSPVPVAGGHGFYAVSAGGSHTCGVTPGTVDSSGLPTANSYCWGLNDHGQLGDGTTTDRTSPVPPATDFGFDMVSAGGSHTCGLYVADEVGYVLCWGANDHGQLGDGTTTDRTSPVSPAPPYGIGFDIIAGGAHTCTGGNCWGANGSGQLGDGTATDRTTAVDIALGGLFVGPMSAGGSHTCMIAGVGSYPQGADPAYCWGLNDHGQLGDGTTTNRTSPVPVVGGLIFLAVSAGGSHTCGVTATTGAYCWGANANGQLGNGMTTGSSVPVKVAGQP